MATSSRLAALLAVAASFLVGAQAASADPSGSGALPPFRVSCTSGDSFLIAFGNIHNRSTQGFDATGTNIMIARTLTIDGVVAFDRAVNANTGNYTTCTGTDSIGEEIVITGFVTPRK